MVIRRTINDWYTNAEGRNTYDSRHDWANDDLPDRTPDSWLDRLEPIVQGVSRRPTRGAGSPSSSSRTAGRNVSTQRDLAEAARALQARMRGIKDATIARHLRQSGWPEVSANHVRDALRAHPAQPERHPAPKSRVQPRSAGQEKGRQRAQGGVRVVTPPAAIRKTTQPSKAAREKPSPSLAEVAHFVRARFPRLGIKNLTKKVQERGWPTATRRQVETALQQPPPSALTIAVQQPSPPTLKIFRTPAAIPREATPARPDACFACGVVPSPLGACRCS